MKVIKLESYDLAMKLLLLARQNLLEDGGVDEARKLLMQVEIILNEVN